MNFLSDFSSNGYQSSFQSFVAADVLSLADALDGSDNMVVGLEADNDGYIL